MQINISTKAVLASLGTVLLGVASWFALGHIDHAARIRDLESDAKEDARQDEELREIRKTMQDMVVLFFAEHGAPHAVPEEVVAGADPDEHAHPEAELFTYEGEDADVEFNAVQTDLESALRVQGIEPATKAAPNKSAPPKGDGKK